MSPDNITIRQFSPSDWQLYKEIRLRALISDPGVFTSTYEKESAYPDNKWVDGAANPDAGIFGVFDGNKVIGMTGIAIDRKDETRSTAVLWGSWLEKDWRGKGISLKMYAARLGWSQTRPILKCIAVSHRESNLASKKANQRHGFSFTHHEGKTWPDGAIASEYFYELKVK